MVIRLVVNLKLNKGTQVRIRSDKIKTRSSNSKDQNKKK